MEYVYVNEVVLSGRIVDAKLYAEYNLARIETAGNTEKRRKRLAEIQRWLRKRKAAGEAVDQARLEARDDGLMQPEIQVRDSAIRHLVCMGQDVVVRGHFRRVKQASVFGPSYEITVVVDDIGPKPILATRAFAQAPDGNGPSVKSIDAVTMDDKNVFRLAGELVSVKSKKGNSEAVRITVRVPDPDTRKMVDLTASAYGVTAVQARKLRQNCQVYICGVIETHPYTNDFGEQRLAQDLVAQTVAINANDTLNIKKAQQPNQQRQKQASNPRTGRTAGPAEAARKAPDNDMPFENGHADSATERQAATMDGEPVQPSKDPEPNVQQAGQQDDSQEQPMPAGTAEGGWSDEEDDVNGEAESTQQEEDDPYAGWR